MIGALSLCERRQMSGFFIARAEAWQAGETAK